MDKKLVFIGLCILFTGLVLIFSSTHMVEKKEELQAFSKTFHYSEAVEEGFNLSKGEKIQISVYGKEPLDKINIVILNEDRNQEAFFIEVYRDQINWSPPRDGRYIFIFYNAVRWHKTTDISITKVYSKTILQKNFLFIGIAFSVIGMFLTFKGSRQ